jgi:UDP-GlcNAc:undecaprenyl-phosphate GlcNAc-1-phosphate transferase
MSYNLKHLLAVTTSFVLALLLTPLVRALARRWGAVARPKIDRWHKKPTAMLGGVAVFLSVIITYVFFLPHTPHGWVVVGASSFLFLVGLIDDLVHTKPYQKLIGQVMGTAFVIYYGLNTTWTRSALLNMVITIFWLIGITNAINLLDNMDGLAGGIAAIASVFLALSFVANGQMMEALMLAVFAAALIGFLVYNFNPASIFMGDCGSMFIGFFLASTALLSVAGTAGRSRSLLPVITVPILILFIPIFDTFVTVLRKLSGRAASQGGRDHTSHRLVALGMSERRAVWMLYGFATLSGLLAILVRQLKLDVSLAAILGFTVLLTLLGVYLAGVKVYDEDEASAAPETPLFAFLVDVSYKRRIFEVLLDVVLIILAYYSAYALVFGPFSMESRDWQLFLRTVPLLVSLKMATFLLVGVYRGIWRYTSVDDLVVFGKGVVIGSITSILAILFAFRFREFSRTVFVLDGMFLLMMLGGSRMAFRLFRQLLPTPMAGDGCRELLNNRELQYAPVGFVDDDPRKKGKVIHGLRVYGGNGQLRSLCREQRVDEVLISSSQFSAERVKEILRDCEEERVVLKRMRIEIEQLSEE